MAAASDELKHSTIPVPDPTTLTNEAVSKAVGALREVLEEQIRGGLAVQDERVKALAETVRVFKETVSDRFDLGEVQTDKATRDVKSAVDAAFAAAKEAVSEQNKSNALSIAKSDTTFTKQIDQLIDVVKTNTKATDDKISDLKDRIVAMEGRGRGMTDTWGWIFGAVGMAVAVVAVVELLLRHQ